MDVGQHWKGTGRRVQGPGESQGCRVPGSVLGGSSACCFLCLAGASTSGWSSWLSSLLTVTTWPPTHHLEAFSSAIKEGGYGGHHHEIVRPEVSRTFVGL